MGSTGLPFLFSAFVCSKFYCCPLRVPVTLLCGLLFLRGHASNQNLESRVPDRALEGLTRCASHMCTGRDIT
eukprot:892757-Amphidinium_carterae.1